MSCCFSNYYMSSVQSLEDILALQGFDPYRLELGAMSYSEMCKLSGGVRAMMWNSRWCWIGSLNTQIRYTFNHDTVCRRRMECASRGICPCGTHCGNSSRTKWLPSYAFDSSRCTSRWSFRRSPQPRANLNQKLKNHLALPFLSVLPRDLLLSCLQTPAHFDAMCAVNQLRDCKWGGDEAWELWSLMWTALLHGFVRKVLIRSLLRRERSASRIVILPRMRSRMSWTNWSTCWWSLLRIPKFQMILLSSAGALLDHGNAQSL